MGSEAQTEKGEAIDQLHDLMGAGVGCQSSDCMSTKITARRRKIPSIICRSLPGTVQRWRLLRRSK
jgi:hypothetical protein